MKLHRAVAPLTLRLTEKVSEEARKLGLNVAYRDLVGMGYLLLWPGTIGKGSDMGSIMIRETDDAETKLFTIAHEIGHFVLGIGGFGEDWSQEVEDRCDEFARELIMRVLYQI